MFCYDTDKMIPLTTRVFGYTPQGQIITFGRATGKYNFIRLSTDDVRQSTAGQIDLPAWHPNQNAWLELPALP